MELSMTDIFPNVELFILARQLDTTLIPSIWVTFLELPNSWDLQTKDIWELVSQLTHSFSADKYQVRFHFWWRETVLEYEKVSKYFFQYWN